MENRWPTLFFTLWLIVSVFVIWNIFVGFILDSYDELVEHKNRAKLIEALKTAQSCVKDFHVKHGIYEEHYSDHDSLDGERIDEVSDHHDHQDVHQSHHEIHTTHEIHND
jgi:hypothetical protein